MFFGGRTLNNAPLAAESNSRWKPAAVGCSLPVDVLERVFFLLIWRSVKNKRHKQMRARNFYAEKVASLFSLRCVCVSLYCTLRFCLLSLTTDRIRSSRRQKRTSPAFWHVLYLPAIIGTTLLFWLLTRKQRALYCVDVVVGFFFVFRLKPRNFSTQGFHDLPYPPPLFAETGVTVSTFQPFCQRTYTLER